jgi:glycosyltransferase involved in cell wall biosynthesis
VGFGSTRSRGSNAPTAEPGSTPSYNDEPRTNDELVQELISRVPDTNGNGNGVVGRRRQRRPRVSVIVPAVNEEGNLPFVLPKIGEWVDEVILVDGRSTDKTLAVARELLPELRIVHQAGKGKGDGLRAGFAAATGDIIVMLDADGSTDPKEIPAFVGALVAGAEFVKGTRFAQGAGTEDMTPLRRLGNKGLLLFVRMLFGGRFSDLCYGYIAFWKRVLPDIDPDSDGFAIETQMSVRALKAGLRISEVPSFERRRIHGKSNLRAIPDGWMILKTIIRERRGGRRAKRRTAELRGPTTAQHWTS